MVIGILYCQSTYTVNQPPHLKGLLRLTIAISISKSMFYSMITLLGDLGVIYFFYPKNLFNLKIRTLFLCGVFVDYVSLTISIMETSLGLYSWFLFDALGNGLYSLFM